MAEGKILPYLDIPFQHASPAGAEEHAPPRAWRKDAGAHPRLARGLPGPCQSARPSSSAFPARRKRISRCCSTGWTRPRSTAPAASNTSRSGARAPTNSASSRCPQEVKEARWHRFMQRQQKISAQLLAEEGRQAPAGHHRRSPRHSGQGPHEIRRARDRRLGAYPVAAAVARRRDRHGQDRPCRRLRSARHGGLSASVKSHSGYPGSEARQVE